MLVKDICNTDVAVATRGTTIAEAARRMRDRHVGSLVVVAEGKGPAQATAMITDRDIALALVTRSSMKPVDVLVGDVCDGRVVVTVDANADVKHAITAMERAGVRRAPVRERGAIVGLLSIDDVIFALADEIATVARLLRRQPTAERARKETSKESGRAASPHALRRHGAPRRTKSVEVADDDSELLAPSSSILGIGPLSDDEMRALTSKSLDESEEREAQLKVLAHESDVSLDEDPADADAMVSAFDQTVEVRTKTRRRR